jgi:hypothetical protein
VPPLNLGRSGGAYNWNRYIHKNHYL